MDVVLAAGTASWESDVVHRLGGSSSVRLVRRCVDVADLLASALSEQPHVALVDVFLTGLDVDCVHRLARAGVTVVAVDADPARAAALGITCCIDAVDVASLGEHGSGGVQDTPTSRASTVAVWGPAGAPGRSTVAVGLSSAMAQRGLDTVLVDADTYGGALGQMLGVLDDVSGLLASCRAANQGRSAETTSHLLDIEPRLRLLSGLPRADMWAQVRTGAFDQVLTHLRSVCEMVVVDCGFSLESGPGSGLGFDASSGRNQTALHVLENSDAIVVVGRPDPVGLSRLIRALIQIKELHPHVSTVVAINQMRSSVGWSERDISSTLLRLTGQRPDVFLPLDQPGVDLASLSGRSPREVQPSSQLVGAFEQLAGAALMAVSSVVTHPG